MADIKLKGQKVRHSTNEFRDLIPNLKLEDYFIIEANLDGNWMYMFALVYCRGRLNNIVCNICSEILAPDTFTKHLKTSDHINALGKVEQFFHPFYTYAKTSRKLAKGECATEAELRDGIIEAIVAMEKTDKNKFSEASRVAQVIQSFNNENSIKFEDDFTSLVLNSKAEVPQNIFVKVGLPLLDLLKVEFSDKKDNWKLLLTTDKPHPNSKYYCVLCSKYCSGIISVNSHLNGYSHKTLQLETIGLRCSSYPYLTKNCSYQFHNTYLLIVKNEAREHFKEEHSQLRDFGKICDTDMKIREDRIVKKENFEVSAQSKKNGRLHVTEEFQTFPDGNSSTLAQPDNEGLIGVEYVVKILKTDNDPFPKYECCLCEIVLNEQLMQGHLISYNHRLKYCTIHYANTIEKYKDAIGHRKYKDFYRVLRSILAKLALAIEEHHGRGIPSIVLSPTFQKKRSEIIAECYNLRHACQQHGPSFSNIVSSREIMEWLKEDDSYEPQNYLPNQPARFTLAPTDKIYLDQRFHEPKNQEKERSVRSINRSKSKSRDDKCYHRGDSQYSYSGSISPSSHDPRTQKRGIRNLDIEDLDTNNIWKVYRNNISVAASEVEYAYMKYRKNPESHPLYEKEWNNFWKRRKDELLSQGIDHRAYNYQEEWVPYFKERLEEMFSEALHTCKNEVRKRLNIPLDAEEDSHQSQSKLKNLEKIEYEKKRSRNDCEDLDKKYNKKAKYKSPERVNSHINNKSSAKADFSTVTDGKHNVIHVLRLMTALEEYLGILGVKIMELLSTALVYERKYVDVPLALEKKMLTAHNCNILETAMEKLKGILYAGLLDDNKIQGFNRVINYTSDLLKHADEIGCRNNLCDSEKSDGNSEFQKLIEELKNKRNDIAACSQKSLSDTLMDLISCEKKDINDLSTKSDLRHKGFRTTDMTASERQANSNRYPVSRLVPEDELNQTNSFRRIADLKSNQIGLANFNTSLRPTEISTVGYSEQSYGNDISSGPSRNSYTNSGSNNFCPSNINNVSSSNISFRGSNNSKNLSYSKREDNYFPSGCNMNNQATSTRKMNNNWDRFHTNGSQFANPHQSHSYQIQPGNRFY